MLQNWLNVSKPIAAWTLASISSEQRSRIAGSTSGYAADWKAYGKAQFRHEVPNESQCGLGLWPGLLQIWNMQRSSCLRGRARRTNSALALAHDNVYCHDTSCSRHDSFVAFDRYQDISLFSPLPHKNDVHISEHALHKNNYKYSSTKIEQGQVNFSL